MNRIPVASNRNLGGESYVRVGSNTDMAILDETGIRFFDASSIRLFDEICERQHKQLLGLAGRRLIERHISSLPYVGVPKAEADSDSNQEQEADPDEDLAWWEPVPSYHFGGPYQLTCNDRLPSQGPGIPAVGEAIAATCGRFGRFYTPFPASGRMRGLSQPEPT